jgi:iron complex transport system substrate-binding protein
VVTDRFPLDTALVVGAPLAGVPSPSNLPGYLGRRVGDARSVGAEATPNLEQVAALDPDLILASIFTVEGTYDEVSQIAPTVAIDDEDSGRWREIHAQVSDVLGRSAAGEEALEEYLARAEELGGRLGEVRVSVVRPRDDGIRIYGKTYFAGQILQDVGLPRPPAQDVQEEEPLDISKELIQRADGDVIFVWSYSEEEQDEAEKLKKDPLWSTLEAVRAGRVYEVGPHWYGSGPLAANAVLDDLERYLAGEG